MKNRILILWALSALFLLSAVSCRNTDLGTASPQKPNEIIVEDIPVSACLPIPCVAEVPEKTAFPSINHFHNTEPDLISIGGTCESNAEIIIESPCETVKISAYGEYFLASVHVPKNLEKCDIILTARAEGKAFSDPFAISAGYVEDAYVYDDEWHILLGNTSRGFARSSFADYEGTNLLSDAEIEAFKKRLNEKTDFLARELPGCELIYMIVPNPLTIYSEEAPKELKKAEGLTRLDQVLEAINSTDATALDLRPVLREHRYDELQPYLHTDTHWSEYGAYLGLGVLCDYISEKYPEAKIRPEEQYGFSSRVVKGGDVIHYLNMDNVLQRESAPFFNPLFKLPVTAKKYLAHDTMRMDFDATSSRITISTGNPSLPDCVVFRDSYGIALYEILPDRFDNTAYYHTWGYNFDKKYILGADPDYVIYIIAERNLDSILK